MRRKGIRQAERRGELSTEQARAEDPDRNVQPGAGHGANGLARRGREVVHQLDDILWKLVGVGGEIAPQRTRGDGVGAGRSSQA